MKKILLTLAAVAMAGSAFAQTTLNGTISFHNRQLIDDSINGGVAHNAPITLNQGAQTASGAPSLFANNAFSVGIFWKNPTTGAYTLANLQGDGTTPGTTPGLQTSFRTVSGSEGTFSGAITVEIAGHAAGTPITFQMRGWLTSQGSFDNATVRGSTADMTIGSLGGTPSGGAPSGPAPLNQLGFTGFQITPEPSTYALGIAGLGALAMIRRRK